jgi:hypothetical protein
MTLEELYAVVGLAVVFAMAFMFSRWVVGKGFKLLAGVIALLTLLFTFAYAIASVALGVTAA